jgi:hypothetical protein
MRRRRPAPTTHIPDDLNGEKDLSRGGELARTHLGTDRPLGGGGPADDAGLAAVGGGAPGAPARLVARAGPRPGGGFARERGGEPIVTMESTRVPISLALPRHDAIAQEIVPRTRGSMSRRG